VNDSLSTQAGGLLGFPPIETTFHGPLLNAVHFVPAQARSFGYACRLEARSQLVARPSK
jgi:hypothetical protein